MSERLTVVLVGCSGAKLPHAAPARELYTSQLFKKARAYAEATGYPWGILSARHGLIFPDQLVEPYDEVLSGRVGELESWGRKTQAQIREAWPDARFVFLAGEKYAYCLRGYGTKRVNGKLIDRLNPLDAVEPLRGMGIGERLRCLTDEVAQRGRPFAGQVAKTSCSCETECAAYELEQDRPDCRYRAP